MSMSLPQVLLHDNHLGENLHEAGAEIVVWFDLIWERSYLSTFSAIFECVVTFLGLKNYESLARLRLQFHQ